MLFRGDVHVFEMPAFSRRVLLYGGSSRQVRWVWWVCGGGGGRDEG